MCWFNFSNALTAKAGLRIRRQDLRASKGVPVTPFTWCTLAGCWRKGLKLGIERGTPVWYKISTKARQNILPETDVFLCCCCWFCFFRLKVRVTKRKGEGLFIHGFSPHMVTKAGVESGSISQVSNGHPYRMLGLLVLVFLCHSSSLPLRESHQKRHPCYIWATPLQYNRFMIS